jgi:hypothetical protein
MNVEIGTEAAKFPEKEYINGIFFSLQFGARELGNCYVVILESDSEYGPL